MTIGNIFNINNGSIFCFFCCPFTFTLFSIRIGTKSVAEYGIYELNNISFFTPFIVSMACPFVTFWSTIVTSSTLPAFIFAIRTE